jgi:sugar diacid utilization regulator
MKHKLLSYYQHSIQQTLPPSPSQLDDYYWFKLNIHDGWFGILKREIDNSQLDLLKTLFDFFQPDENQKKEELAWSQFLYFHGETPSMKEMEVIRMIQFQINGNELERSLIESAFNGFISPTSLLIWNGQKEGVVIEKDKQYLEDEEFASLAQALQTDFYFTTTFYIGKEVQVNHDIPTIFSQERSLFLKGISLMPAHRILSLDTILPNLLINRLQEEELELFKQWFFIFEEDKELLLTIKTFIENNGHSTNAAKQLFIHRNTLQYRLDKFTEKTGFHLNDYNSFFIAYLACLFFSTH